MPHTLGGGLAAVSLFSEKVLCRFGIQTSEERLLAGADVFGGEGKVGWSVMKLVLRLLEKLQTGFSCCHKKVQLLPR